MDRLQETEKNGIFPASVGHGCQEIQLNWKKKPNVQAQSGL